MRGKLHSVYVQSRTGLLKRQCTSCPLKARAQECSLVVGLQCLYGYTQVQVPKTCPLRQGNVVLSLERISQPEHQAIGQTEHQLSKERRDRLTKRDEALFESTNPPCRGSEDEAEGGK